MRNTSGQVHVRPVEHQEGKGLHDKVLEARREAYITEMVERKAASLATARIEDLMCPYCLEEFRQHFINCILKCYKKELRDRLQFEEDDAASLN